MSKYDLPPYRFKSIHSLFVGGIIIVITVVSLPLLFSGVSIIDDISYEFGHEILSEQLKSLIEPIDLRYKTIERIGLEDSETHLLEIKNSALADMGHFHYKDTGSIFVVENQGKILLATDFSTHNVPSLAEFRQESGMIEYQTATRNRIGVVQYYSPWNAYIGLSMDRGELFAPRSLFIRISLVVLFCVLFFASLCAVAIYHLIVSPVLRITHFAEQVNRGNLHATIPGTFILELATVKKDITGMVAALINREKKYRAIFNAPSDVILLHEGEGGKILEVNSAIQTMYGYTPDECLSMTIGDISSGQYPYTTEGAANKIQELSLVEQLRFEWHCKKKNGELFWVDVSLLPLHLEGEFRVLAVIRDIDKQKKDRENLTSEKEQLAITLRSIGDGVITTDRKGHIVLINKIAEELTGWSQQESVGRSLNEILHLFDGKDGKDDRVEVDPVTEVLETGRQIEFPRDTFLISRDGSRKEIADSVAPIFDSNSLVVGVVLVFRDITERKHLEKEVQKIKKLESVGVLAGGIAHDFNNLLSAILGNINLTRLLIESDSRPDELLAEAEKASLRARKLTQQLLTFSKGGEPIRETTDLAEIISENATFVLRGSSTRYDLMVPNDLWQADIDPGQIGQVIQNIIINSRQAMGEKGGHITINAKNCSNCTDHHVLSKSCIHMSIKDDGPGMSPHILEKIFDPYFTTKEDGSGLGLAICHSIIKKHNGILLVESTPGQGTHFTIKLPISREDSSPDSDIMEVGRSLHPLKVLVMDDEEILLTIVSEMLLMLGHQVKTVKNGTEAIHLFEKESKDGSPFDAIILDLTIPGEMGGKEAGGKLLELDPHAKIIVASGYSNDPVIANYQDYGFTGRLIKPFHLQDLEKTLTSLQTI
jgi:PAS domain S-box-containing protein